MPPLFAHFRSDPDEFRSAALNRLDRVDVIHVKCVEIGFEIDRPLHAAAQEFEQFGACPVQSPPAWPVSPEAAAPWTKLRHLAYLGKR